MWNKLKWQLQRFMIGRNGRDELEQACFYLSFVIYILGTILSSLQIEFLACSGFLYCIFRILSKNVYRRQEENRRFLQKLEFWKLRISMRKTHKIYRCKGCGRKIRVPRGKGKIEITCPLCRNKIIRRT